MKKLIFASFLIAICGQAFAEPSLATVLEWKYGACAGTKQADENDSSPNPKMVISYWKCNAPQPSESQIEQDFNDYESSQAYYSERFNSDVFETALWTKFALGGFSFSMRNEAYNLKEFCKRKNFVGLKQYLQLLLLNSVATQTDINGVKECLGAQGIDLDLWE